MDPNPVEDMNESIQSRRERERETRKKREKEEDSHIPYTVVTSTEYHPHYSVTGINIYTLIMQPSIIDINI